MEIFEGYTGPPSDDETNPIADLPAMVPTLLNLLLEDSESEGFPFSFPKPNRQTTESNFVSNNFSPKESDSDSFVSLKGDLLSELGNVITNKKL